MALIPQYQRFKANLLGYTEVPFDEFRRKIIPLRQKRGAWSDEESEYVRSLVNGGAGHALQQLFGLKHKAASAVLGEAEILPEPMTKTELDSHMASLVKNCLTAGWPPERFVAFALYLDSDMTPRQLVERDREARRRRALESSMFLQAKQGSLSAAAAKDDWDDGEAPEKDRFAEMYRRAGPAFKRVVSECLALAAEKAQSRQPQQSQADA